MLIAHIDDEDTILKSSSRLMKAFRERLEVARKAAAEDAKDAEPADQTALEPDALPALEISPLDLEDPETLLAYWVDHGLRRNLAPADLEFETSASGEEFWKKVKRRRKAGHELPSLVVLDLKLDGVDEQSGLKVLDKLKGPKGLGNVPVVMLTTYTDSDLVTQSYARGANGYVGKGDFGEFDSRFFELITHWAGTSRLPTPGQ